MTDHVLDASVILAILANEPGATDAARFVTKALIGAANHCEIVSKLTEWGRGRDSILASLRLFDCRIVDFDQGLAFTAGLLRAETKPLGLSLGDRACLALALREKLPVYTTDRRWKQLQIGVDVRLLR